MKAEQLDQVTLYVRNLEESTQFFSDVLGFTFLAPIEANIGGQRVRFAMSTAGIGLAQPDQPAEEGVRAVGIKVDDMEELKKRLMSRGLKPIVDTQTDKFHEVQYVIGGVRFNFGQYEPAPVPAPNRILALRRLGILKDAED